MNNSKKKAFVNSANSAAESFDTAYATYTLMNSGGINGITGDDLDDLLSGIPVSLDNSADALGINDTDYDLDNSYVYYNYETGKFTVCFVANTSGSFYLAELAMGSFRIRNPKVDGSNIDVWYPDEDNDYMWACSGSGSNKVSWNQS